VRSAKSSRKTEANGKSKIHAHITKTSEDLQT
jgi:hypothetical protein